MIPAALRLSWQFDPERLQADLDGCSEAEAFVRHFNIHMYEGDWSALPLRSLGGRSGQIFPDPDADEGFADTVLLDRCPYVREVLGRFECPLLAVRFLKLRAGSIVREHRDFALDYEDGEVRLHVPVRTNPQVEFVVDGRRVDMAEGSLWYVNVNLPHRVANHGATDRVHLVIDCEVNDWLRGWFEREAAMVAASRSS
jgi:hypothetical protein